MLEVRIRGQGNRVRAFLEDLLFCPRVHRVEKKEDGLTEIRGETEVTCRVDHRPKKRVTVIRLTTVDGARLDIPILDLVQVQMEEDKRLFVGRSFDIFAPCGDPSDPF